MRQSFVSASRGDSQYGARSNRIAAGRSAAAASRHGVEQCRKTVYGASDEASIGLSCRACFSSLAPHACNRCSNYEEQWEGTTDFPLPFREHKKPNNYKNIGAVVMT